MEQKSKAVVTVSYHYLRLNGLILQPILSMAGES